ncbi:WAP, Kazal, immunoglobulin, Kunitz and NTR domain-containing protein-like isoform X2 [Dermacentor albipictus]|uniref:WAP, Kazal, immunoglobulin, Kunitz and NTR domain-containing protein-like isoform X2 n=1 Tax=Dermacentor albipictus TaxID=60249 RepID=UPI0031FBB1C3
MRREKSPQVRTGCEKTQCTAITALFVLALATSSGAKRVASARIWRLEGLGKDFLNDQEEKVEGKKHKCLYVPIGGICNVSSIVYYYSPMEGDCKKWDGCLGRGFYFSRPRCERACRDAPYGICALEKDEGTFGVPPFQKKYFYNQITQQCEAFDYQGNGEENARANRFDDWSQCQDVLTESTIQ